MICLTVDLYNLLFINDCIYQSPHQIPENLTIDPLELVGSASPSTVYQIIVYLEKQRELSEKLTDPKKVKLLDTKSTKL